MVKKRGSDNGNAMTPRSDLSARAEALTKAAKSLQDSANQMAEQMQQRAGQPATTGESDRDSTATFETQTQFENVSPSFRSKPEAVSQDPLAQPYYAQLEQTGQLADVDEHTDLSKLSPRITHIRHPDGSIERIGFS